MRHVWALQTHSDKWLVHTMKRALLFGLIGLIMLAGTALGTTRSSLSSVLPAAEDGVATTATADTLRHRVPAGDDLIVTLPGTLSQRTVASYTIVRAPALSWLVDRSLLWRTRPNNAGTHALLLQASFQNAAPDTLTILVDVTP